MSFKLPLMVVGAAATLFLIYSLVIGLPADKDKPLSSDLSAQTDFSNTSGLFDVEEKYAFFDGKSIDVPPEPEEQSKYVAQVLGERSDRKRIEVDLTNQKLYAYEGDNKIYDFLVSTGKWGATPTGEFRIWTKFKYTLMTGGSQQLGTYYYLPNVPFTMYFYNNQVPKGLGYGIHGTYWHNNFGHPMSHGCINLRTEDAEKLFYWANPSLQEGQHNVYADEANTGTRVIIYGTAPQQ